MFRSLFLKIFLWFCVVMVTVIATTFIVAELGRPEPFRPPPRPLDKAVQINAEAADLYEREGQTALAAYLDKLEFDTGINGWLFNDQTQEVSGRPTPAAASQLATRALTTGRSEVMEHGPRPLVAHLVTTQARR